VTRNTGVKMFAGLVSDRIVRVINRTRNRELAARAAVADTFWTRLRGLLGRSGLGPGEGLVLTRTNSVHSLGMRFAIDVIHVDHAGRVCRLLTPLPPWRLGPIVRGGEYVIEVPAGVVAETGTGLGDDIEIVPQVASRD